MVVYRLAGTTSLLSNNLVTFTNDKTSNEEVLAIVAPKQAVLVGERNRVKIESGLVLVSSRLFVN